MKIFKKTNNPIIINSIVYITSNLLLKAFNFLLLPLYTRYLSTDDYGITSLVTKFQNVACYIISCCLHTSAIRMYADYKNDNEKVKRLFGTIVTFVFLCAISFLVLCVVFNKVLIRLVFSGVVFWPTIFMSMIALIFITLFMIFQEIMKGMQKAKHVAFASFLYFFVQFGLNILMVVILKKGANGVIFSSIISNFLASMVILVYLIKKKLIKFCIDRKMLKECLMYSLPLLPHNVSASASSLISNVFINDFGSLSSVGIFSLASQFGSVAETVESSSNTAFQPWYYRQMNENKGDAVPSIRKTSDLLVWFYGFVLIGICFFSKEVILFLCDRAYSDAWTVVPLIAVVYIINIPYFFYVNILFYNKKGTKYIFLATLPASCLNICLSFFFIQWWGMYGSVISDIIFVVVKFLIIFLLSRKFDKDTYSIFSFLGKMFLIVVICLIGIVPSFLFYRENVAFNEFMFKIMLLIFYSLLALSYYQKSKHINTPGNNA